MKNQKQSQITIKVKTLNSNLIDEKLKEIKDVVTAIKDAGVKVKFMCGEPAYGVGNLEESLEKQVVIKTEETSPTSKDYHVEMHVFQIDTVETLKKKLEKVSDREEKIKEMRIQDEIKKYQKAMEKEVMKNSPILWMNLKAHFEE